MAVYLLRANWAQGTGVDRDTCVWGYHVETEGDPPSASAWEFDFRQALNVGASPLTVILPDALVVQELQVYNVSVGGPPVDEIVPTAPIEGAGGIGGPSEVSVVVSRWTNDKLGRPFKKGRTYVGPFADSIISGPRPPSGATNRIQAFQQQLHANLVGRGLTPVVDTKGALHVPHPIVQYSIDNAWDTQRRRGLDPTDETTFPPIAPE